MNNKGIAVSGILYTLLLITVIMISMMLFNLQNRKTILDTLKSDSIEAVEKNTNMEALFEEIASLKEQISTMKESYPIGSIYLSTVYDTKEKVSEALGGTWEVYGSGRTLIGADGSTYKAGNTGGSNSVTLATANLPSHSHTFTGTAKNYTSGNQSANHTHSIPALSGTAASAGSHQHNSARGYWNTSWTDGNGSRQAIAFNDISSSDPWTANLTSSAGAHTHSVTTKASTTGSNSANHTHTTTVTPEGTIGSTGSGTAFSVQNPYVVVYMWKRVS